MFAAFVPAVLVVRALMGEASPAVSRAAGPQMEATVASNPTGRAEQRRAAAAADVPAAAQGPVIRPGPAQSVDLSAVRYWSDQGVQALYRPGQ